MKIKGLLFVSVLMATFITGCSTIKPPAPKTLQITFHQEQGNQDDVFEYVVGQTSYMEVKSFQDEIRLNTRRGYDVSWEEFDLSTISEDYTVNALYSLHNYTISFVYESRTIGTATYTIESTSVVEPDLPTTAGYIYHYEEYSIEGRAEDFTVRAYRELATYQATFVDIDGHVVGEPISFNVETEDINEPDVPEILGKDGEWEDYELGASDIVIHPVYKTHYYKANFYTSDLEDRELVETVLFTLDDTFIDEPAVPFSSDYRDGKWCDYTLGAEDIDIYPIYGDYHVFTIYYKKTGTDSSPATATFTFETRNQVLLDNNTGYITYWKYDNVEYEGGKEYELPMQDINFVLSRKVLRTYYASFWSEKGDEKELIAKVPFNIETTSIEEPTVPDNPVCTGGHWEEYSFIAQDIDIYPVYEGYVVFTAYYKQDVDDENPVEVNFTFESKNQTILNDEFGYTTYWMMDDEEYEGGKEYELPMHDVTFIKSRKEGHVHTITLDPNGGELLNGNVMEVTYGSSYSIETPTYYSTFNGLKNWYLDQYTTFPSSGTYELDEDIFLTAQYGLSFEEDTVPSFITPKQQIQSLSITDETSTLGQKSLKVIPTTGDYGIYFSKEYLDDTFSNPDIVAINFDAKGKTATSNFRAKIAGNNTTYEQNNTDYGLDTVWKKFSFRREYYEAYVSGDAMIYGNSACEILYVDNIVPVTKELDSLGFENGFYKASAKTYMSAGHSNSQPAPEQIFKLSPDSKCELSNIGFDYEDKTEGNRSFTFEKTNGYLAIYLSTAIKNSLDDNDYIQFDFKTTVIINSNPSVKNATDGMNVPFGDTGYQIAKDKWITFTLYSSNLTKDGRFMIIQGSTAGTYHFDNIRIVHVD